MPVNERITFRFLFEQSGTFKKVALKLGHLAYDYDIKNDFGETDYQIDLFDEIERAYAGEGGSMFDSFAPNEIIVAFFPCIRFSNQFMFHIAGNAHGYEKYTRERKLLNSLRFHDELNRFYSLLCKLFLVCERRNLKLVVENPSKGSYLNNYFPVKPAIVYNDRHAHGDYYEKPTMFFFDGFEPEDNPLFEPVQSLPRKRIKEERTVERSMISPAFAEYFIKSHLLKLGNWEDCAFGFLVGGAIHE